LPQEKRLNEVAVTHRHPEAERGNQNYWDELAPVHIKSYNIARLRDGGHVLDDIQIADVGDVCGKSMLHLQCHIGTDTLSWVRLGAKVTGVDFSLKSIEQARSLAQELGLEAEFITCNVYDLPQHLDREFDIVYTSMGVLCWLSDLNAWGKLIHRHLKPEGLFYILESHPLLGVFDDTGTLELKVRHEYFHRSQPTKWEDACPDYSDENYTAKTPSFEWQWSLGDIVNALISAGLRIESLNEYGKTFYKAHPDMKRADDGWWYLPEKKRQIPLMFTLKARKIS
jgi:ubiquinone/menaquinone biosynthesis C-methylase UbiE